MSALLSYIFVSLWFTGQLAVVEWTVFVAFFLLIFFGFEKFSDWAVTLE